MEVSVIIALVFIVLDIASGVIKGAATGSLSSSVMRSGLWKKSAEVLLIILAIVSNLAITFTGMGEYIPTGIFQAVIVYVILMELVSIIENICEINPDMKLADIMGMFGQKEK